MQIPTSENFGEELFETSDGFLLSGNNGKVILLNDVGRNIWGLKKSVTTGFDVCKLVKIASLSARDPDKFFSKTMQLIRSKNRVERVEISLVGGKVIDFHTFPMVGADNKIHGRIWYFRDITEQKMVEDLRNLQHIMMENLGEGVVMVAAEDNKIVYSNKRFEKIYGYKRNELIGKCVCILNAPQDNLTCQEVSSMINKSVSDTGEWRGIIKSIKKDGTFIWSEAKTVPIYHSRYGNTLVSIQSDVTDKFISDKKLQESEKRYRVLFENSHEAIVFISEDGRVLDANPAAQRLVGYSLGDFKKLMRDAFVDLSDKRIHKLLEHRDRFAYFRGNFRVIRRDGKKINCEGTAVTFKDRGGFEQSHVVFREC